MICGKLSEMQKMLLKTVYEMKPYEEFEAKCKLIQYSPEEVLEELGIDSSSSQPMLQSDHKQGNVDTLGGYSTIALYYDYGNMKTAMDKFKNWIINAVLITKSEDKIIFKNPSTINASLSELKRNLLNELALEFDLDQIDTFDSLTDKNTKAKDILAYSYSNLDHKSNEKRNILLDKYVFVKHLDEIINEQAPYIRINPAFKNIADIFVNSKYEYAKGSVEHFKGFSKSEYASADDMSSVFVKTILASLPQLDAQGNIIPGKYTNFNAILSCFSQVKKWLNSEQSSEVVTVQKELEKGINADLGKVIEFYLQNNKYNPLLVPHFNVLTKLIYAKSNNHFIVPEYYRHIITNMFTKFVDSTYVQYIQDLQNDTFIAVPLTERLTMIERMNFKKSVVGSVINISRNPTEFYNLLELVNPTQADLAQLGYNESVQIIKYLTNKTFTKEDYSVKLHEALKSTIKYVKSNIDQITSSINIEEGINNFLSRFESDNMFGVYSDIAAVLVQNSISDVRSVIKNADGNNLPLTQLSSLVYKAKDMAKRTGEAWKSGFPYIYANVDNLPKPIIQTTATLNGKNIPISKMSVEDLQIVAIENNFINQLLLSEKNGLRYIDNDGKRRIYMQLDCYSDKSTIFLFPIDLNIKYKKNEYDSGINVYDHLKNTLKTGHSDELSKMIIDIYKDYYTGQIQSLISDYQTVFGNEVTFANYEDFISNKIKQLGITGFIAAFNKKGVNCVNEVHYSKNGINKQLKELYNIFSHDGSAQTYLKQQRDLALSMLLGEKKVTDDGLHYSGAWEHICENKLLKQFLQIDKLPSRKSSFAIPPKYTGVSEFDFEEFVPEIDEESEFSENTDSRIETTYLPEQYAKNIVTAFMYADLLFARPINCFLVGDFYAHKGGDISSRYIMQTKRQSIQGATVHSYAQDLKYGVTKEINISVIEDITAKTSNIIGDVNTALDANDGSGWSSPLFSRMANASLLDAEVGATKKTTFGDINPTTGTAVYLKWAEYEISNTLMRKQASKLNMRNLFRKMHSAVLPTTILTKTYSPINMYYKLISGESIKINSLTIDGNNKTLTLQIENITTKEKRNESIIFSNIDDIYTALGGAFCQKIVNDTLIWSEDNLDLLHQIVCDFDWKNSFIAIAANSSAVKSGITNLNPVESWYNTDSLYSFKMSTEFGGVMMNADHNLEDSESTEPTQMILALVEKGYSLEQAKKVYKDIAEIIDESMVDFAKTVQTADNSELLKKANDLVVKSMERKSKSYGLAGSFVRAYLKDNANSIPLGTPSINNIFRSEVLSWITKNAIKRKYGGVAAVLNPSYNIMQYHVINGKSYLYDELIFKPEIQTLVKDGHSIYDIFNNIEYLTVDEQSVINPFLVPVTNENPIDFEDTIVIKNTEVLNSDLQTINYIDQYGNNTDQKYEIIKIESFEDYIKYRHRTDLQIFNWTIRPHNLKGVDIIHTYKDNNGDIYSFSANESIVNLALWTLKNKKHKTIRQLWEELYKVHLANNVKKEQLLQIIDERVSQIESLLSTFSEKQLVNEQRRRLYKPKQDFLYKGHNLSFIGQQTIPAQIIMGRVYAKQFGLTHNDYINDIRTKGVEFWRKKLADKYRYSDLMYSEDADFILYNDEGKRILIKYVDSEHPLSEDLKSAPNSEDFDVVENNVYYKGEILIPNANVSIKQITTSNGNVNDVFIINDFSILDALVQSDFNKLLYNFTESNFDVVFKRRYPFTKVSSYKVWADGELLETEIVASDINKVGAEKSLFIKLLNVSEISRFNYNLDKDATLKHRMFEDSLTFVGTRIPCQSMQSFMPCKICNFADTEINEVYVPKHLSWIQGSD